MDEQQQDSEFWTKPMKVDPVALRDAVETLRALINPLLRQGTIHHNDIVEHEKRLAKLEGRSDGGARKV
jgi:hypothetical protein